VFVVLQKNNNWGDKIQCSMYNVQCTVYNVKNKRLELITAKKNMVAKKREKKWHADFHRSSG